MKSRCSAQRSGLLIPELDTSFLPRCPSVPVFQVNLFQSHGEEESKPTGRLAACPRRISTRKCRTGREERHRAKVGSALTEAVPARRLGVAVKVLVEVAAEGGNSQQARLRNK
jgi:hypothetical protein